MLSRALNTAWTLTCRREAARFREATRDIEVAQAQRFRRILNDNVNSWFGRRHRFAEIRNVNDFRARVPLSDHENYRGPIERIARGETGVLTSEPITLLEPTSGSSGPEKLIPYTATLRREFQRGLAPWICDLFATHPRAARGRAYWSISPAFGNRRRTQGGIPIGFDDDSAYLGRVGRRTADRLMVRPPGIARVADLDAFRYCTLLWLMHAGDLSLISVWSPTFLSTLLEGLTPWTDRLIHDVRNGTVSPPATIDPSLLATMQASIRPDPRRAEELSSIFSISTAPADVTGLIWPRLALISCWGDRAAAGHLEDLRSLFPAVPIQPKGLLSTEAFVTFPLGNRDGAALALRSHYFEFEQPDGTIHQAHELEPGGAYAVIVTTGGGLYRYRLHDLVEVTGFHNRCPLLRLVGRTNQVSDLVGEKLSDDFAREALDRAFTRAPLPHRHRMLAPALKPIPHYQLYLQTPNHDDPQLAELEQALEAELERNPHYRYAVHLRQLGPVRILPHPEAGDLRALHERARIAAGQKLGDIKPAALETRLDVVRELERLTRVDSNDDALRVRQPA